MVALEKPLCWRGGWRRRAVAAAAGALIGAVLAVPGAAAAAGGPVIYNSGLAAISCSGGSMCMAVGSYEDSAGPSSIRTLSEQWNGTAWSYVPSPTPASKNGGALFDGVSCASGLSCVAVGVRLISPGSSGVTNTPLAEIWNGTAWRLDQAPAPAGQNATLNAVSCSAATQCVAVGSAGPAQAPRHMLAEQWNGTRWRILPGPVVRSPGLRTLTGVSCSGVTTCMAVGYDTVNVKRDNEVPVAELWNGSRWRRLHQHRGYGALNGVSCSGPHACAAVGEGLGFPGPTTAAEMWNGSAWTLQRSANPDPGDSFGAWLQAVSCTAPAMCMAAGSWAPQSVEGTLTLTEMWNGSKWAIVPSHSPGSYTDELLGVACPTAANCLAVGDDQGNGAEVPLAEQWNGAHWKVVPTPPGPPATASLRGGFLTQVMTGEPVLPGS